MKSVPRGICTAMLALAIGSTLAAVRPVSATCLVRVRPNESARRVDITVDGQPFTSYIWPESLTKPVLYPIISATGETVTRGFPLDPQRGERTDHPHQVGLWLTYGNVNGIDFWNNSTTSPASERTKMGTIVQRRIVHTEDGVGKGELEVEAEWLMPDGVPVLKEETRFIFCAAGNTRSIDRITQLTAERGKVEFKDDKEGVFGMRVARWLEGPELKAQTLTDSSGKKTEVPESDGCGATGEYVTSEGIKGDAVWGTRGRWCLLHGHTPGMRDVITGRSGRHILGSEPAEMTLAILDHPGNPGFPTYWHARSYGLFAANPLGEKQLSGGKQELNFTLGSGKTATFKYRVLIVSGPPSVEQIEAQYRDFAGR
ncbi:MAG TPA: PmoA family protein [Blastocatellia bacterium]